MGVISCPVRMGEWGPASLSRFPSRSPRESRGRRRQSQTKRLLIVMGLFCLLGSSHKLCTCQVETLPHIRRPSKQGTANDDKGTLLNKNFNKPGAKTVSHRAIYRIRQVTRLTEKV